MKRIIAMLICAGLLLTACASSDDGGSSQSETSAAQAETTVDISSDGTDYIEIAYVDVPDGLKQYSSFEEYLDTYQNIDLQELEHPENAIMELCLLLPVSSENVDLSSWDSDGSAYYYTYDTVFQIYSYIALQKGRDFDVNSHVGRIDDYYSFVSSAFSLNPDINDDYVLDDSEALDVAYNVCKKILENFEGASLTLGYGIEEYSPDALDTIYENWSNDSVFYVNIFLNHTNDKGKVEISVGYSAGFEVTVRYTESYTVE